MDVPRSGLGFLVVACGLASLAACQRTHSPPVTLIDAGPPDAGPPADLDTDGDGLCDFTEFQRRTDASSADTDGDGFSDYVEAQNGSDPSALSSPDRSLMLILSEAPGATLDTPVSFAVRGIGETFAGALVRLPLNIVDDGSEARTFYVGSDAVGASPMANVRGGIEGASYLGVVGRTLLPFTLHFAQRQAPRGCMRAYPFNYNLKTSDGQLRGSLQRWIVLMPPGMDIGAPGARWCGPVTTRCL